MTTHEKSAGVASALSKKHLVKCFVDDLIYLLMSPRLLTMQALKPIVTHLNVLGRSRLVHWEFPVFRTIQGLKFNFNVNWKRSNHPRTFLA